MKTTIPTASDVDPEVHFQSTFQNAFVGIAHVGLDGRWLNVNARLADMLGYSEEGLLALTFQDITHPDDLDNDLSLLSRLASGELNHYTMETRYYQQNGKIIWILLQVIPQFDEAGAVRYYVATITDISVTKRLEQKLQDAALEMENLLHVLGHELRGSLNAIAVHTQLIEHISQTQGLPEQVEKSLSTIQDNITASSDFLSYVDSMAGFQSEASVSEVIWLDAVVDQVLKNSDVNLKETATRVDRPQSLPDVLGHPVAVTRVMQNLVDNAVKYRRIDQPCIITITAKTSDGSVLVEVHDTGRGIPKDEIHKIFDPAWRASNVGTAPGRGLGLAFCRRLMEKLEGTIEVVSEEGKGTSFTLAFKAATR